MGTMFGIHRAPTMYPRHFKCCQGVIHRLFQLVCGQVACLRLKGRMSLDVTLKQETTLDMFLCKALLFWQSSASSRLDRHGVCLLELHCYVCLKLFALICALSESIWNRRVLHFCVTIGLFRQDDRQKKMENRKGRRMNEHMSKWTFEPTDT